jgi:uncharacterized repeat protein (TIGR01451 family)
VPVDLTGAIALFVEHTVSRSEAEWGDQLEYVIRVANRSDSSLAAVTLHESLPPGFAYERGSALGGALDASGPCAALQRPESEAGASGPALAFGIGPLGPQAGYELRLRVRVRAGATPGDARAVAQAVAALAASNTAIASVLVRGDVFADEGGILGSVRVLSAEGALTSGLAGVRVFLDDGTWALTDAQGRFSFTGLSARTHALKLDRTTLPPRSAPGRARAPRRRDPRPAFRGPAARRVRACGLRRLRRHVGHARSTGPAHGRTAPRRGVALAAPCHAAPRAALAHRRPSHAARRGHVHG